MMITVLDKGPREPAPIDDDADEAVVARHKAEVRHHAEWHDRHKRPVETRMPSVDAHEAIARDPERYSEVRRDVVKRKPGGLEDRLAAIEERLDRLESPDDSDEPQAPVAGSDATGPIVDSTEQPTPRRIAPRPGSPLTKPLPNADES